MRIGLKQSIFACFLIVTSTSIQAEYMIGDGIELGSVFLSGYSKIELEAANGKPQELLIDDLSLFASASINRYINPFIEAEITKAQLWQEGNGAGFRNSKLVLERLYNDVHFNSEVNIRLGKSLAPVGEWNRIHAAPLVWTTKRPITTQYSFSESISGVSVQHTQRNNNVFHAYYQPGSEWSEKPKDKNRPRAYEHVGGISFDMYFSLDSKLGFAIQHADVKNTADSQWVFSMDGQWQSEQLAFEFQTTFADIDSQIPTTAQNEEEWGGYIQGVWHLNERWHVILRPEYFSSRVNESQSNMLYGITYRPQPAISLKLEYIDTNGERSFGVSQGVFASMAVLF